MKVFDGNWKAFAARTVVFCVAAFGTIRLAVARDGVAGGPARSFVTVAGTITGVSGTSVMLTFEFQRREAGVTTLLCSQTVTAQLGAGGGFSVPVPISPPESTCPGNMFDGRDVWVRTSVGGTAVGEWAPINPVPYAHFASQYGTPDCPVGYERNTMEPGFEERSDNPRRLCQRSRIEGSARVVFDEVVRVGTGASAFWIDRYEASVWRTPSATRGLSDSPAVPFGAGDQADYPREFPPNGQVAITAHLFATSRAMIHPSAFLTWFQANEACAASGKRLPVGDEWLRAARRTPDLADRCQISGARDLRNTGLGSQCQSDWGAQDMIGNLWEWTAEWYAGAGQTVSLEGRPEITVNSVNPDGGASIPTRIPERPAITRGITSDRAQNWPSPDYNGDGTYNINNYTNRLPNDGVLGLPAAAIRGGQSLDGPRAGIFALNLVIAPSHGDPGIGFRCVIPR